MHADKIRHVHMGKSKTRRGRYCPAASAVYSPITTRTYDTKTYTKYTRSSHHQCYMAELGTKSLYRNTGSPYGSLPRSHVLPCCASIWQHIMKVFYMQCFTVWQLISFFLYGGMCMKYKGRVSGERVSDNVITSCLELIY